VKAPVRVEKCRPVVFERRALELIGDAAEFVGNPPSDRRESGGFWLDRETESVQLVELRLSVRRREPPADQLRVE
jgi:hypothetical protein